MADGIVTSNTNIEPRPFDFRQYGTRAVICALLGVFWITYFWDIWSRGVISLGVNATVFALIVLFLLGLGTESKTLFSRNQLVWVLPSILIALSYSLYENTFFKSVSIFVFPLLLAWFYNYGLMLDRKNVWFDRAVLHKIFLRSSHRLAKHIRPACCAYLDWVCAITRFDEVVIKRISFGFLGLVAAGFIVIPLLYSSDDLFAAKLDAIAEWPLRVFTWSALNKAYVFIVITVTGFASAIAWQGPWKLPKEAKKRSVDALVSGIVLGGVLCLYALFIATQVERLWIDKLPVDFETTESLVKTGFWQLIALSFLNSGFFIFLYRKTNGVVQLLLSAFSVASLLILISAGHRMYLYVASYGLSYEKFYASYSVVFCAFLLAFLAYVSVTRIKTNILKYAMFLFLWMYTTVSVLPVERIIFETNLALAKRSERIESIRLDQNWIRELSTDVLPRALYFVRSHQPADSDVINRYVWRQWIQKRVADAESKAWHQHNIGSIIVKLGDSESYWIN